MTLALVGLLQLSIARGLDAPAAAELPPQSAHPGGIALVDIGPVSNSPPRATFRSLPVLVTESVGRHVAIVGLRLSLEPGKYEIQVQTPGREEEIRSFEVNERDYPEQRITIKNRAMVSPNADQLVRIRREQVSMKAAYRRFEPRPTTTLRMSLPVSAPLSSAFGLRRFFNGEPRRPHGGLDLASPRGTPIKAPAAGRVVIADNYYFNGNTVFLDHGSGLITMYCHLDRIDVVIGDEIEERDVLGVVGSTGRATGPHLHWTVSLNDARVDPMLLVGSALPELTE